jgi:glutaredoxin
MSIVKIYGKANCAWCKEAKALVERYQIPYEYIDVGYTDGMKELMERLPDAKTVPQIWWYDRHVGGYQEFAKEVEDTLSGYGEQKI